MNDLVGEVVKVAVTMVAGGAVGWLVAAFKIDSKIVAAKVDHESSHRRLEDSLAKLREAIDEVSERVTDDREQSRDEFAKEARVAQELSSLHELCREVIASVSRLEGSVETMLKLAEHGPPTRPRR